MPENNNATQETVEAPINVSVSLVGYHTRFTEESFPPAVITTSKQLMTLIWGQPKEVRIEAINTWLQAVSTAYGVNKPTFVIVQGDAGRILHVRNGGGLYDPLTNTITLYRKFSFTTLLHEYRHALQHLTGAAVQLEDIEEDARGWSCSLYFVCDNERYMRAAQGGLLHFA